MKTKQLFFCSLTGLTLLAASCSSNDEALNGGDGTTSEGKTYAQIAISVANSATTRADGDNTGDDVLVPTMNTPSMTLLWCWPMRMTLLCRSLLQH